MSININLDTTGLDASLKQIAVLSPAAHRAATRAQNKTLRWGGTRAARAIAKANGIQVKGAKRRVYTYPARPPGKPVGILWVGGNDMPAAYMGRLRQTKTAAWAGRHKIPGAFVATMPSGYTSLFIRNRAGTGWSGDRPASSPPNLPIDEITIPIEGFERIILAVGAEMEDRYRQTLVQELNYELNVKGQRANKVQQKP